MTRERRIILATVSAATAMLLLDVTVVNVALPAIGDDLGAGFDELQWVIDAYALSLAATLLGAGVLADRFGRRTVFAWGLAVFTACSALCGAASSGLMLDLSRAAQGLGAAAMFAASLALLAHEFRGAQRGVALGVWGAITGASLALGPVVGGVVVDAIGWRWIFLVNLPVGVALIWLTLRALPQSHGDRARPLDPVGMITFGAACLLATYGLIRGNAQGWDSIAISGSLAASAALLGVFIAAERRTAAPMLPLGLFRNSAFSGTAMVAFAQSVAIYPMFLFLAVYLQDGLGLSPTETGLRLLPMTVVFFIAAPISGKLTARTELRVPLVMGLLLIAFSLVLMRGVEVTSEWTHLLPGFIVGGLGMGVISPALAAAMVSVLPSAQNGLASGINNTFRQLGIAIGIAGLGAIFVHRAGHATSSLAGLVDGLNAVLLVSCLVAAVAAAAAWPLLGHQRSDVEPEID
ncbi:MAG: MFS transporter [Actinobacteria bacterium]|nr:MFS transporter [Actinomycetota bacterium]